LNIFIGVSFVMCLVMMGQNYGVSFVTELNGSRNQSVLLNPNHFGYILALSIPCVGGRLIAQKRPMPAMLLGLLYVFECRTLMLNGSFGSELAVFAALLLMAPVYRLTLACGKKPWRAVLPLAIFTAVYLLSGSLGEGRGGNDAASLLSDAANIIESSVSGGESLKTPLYNSDRLELWKAAVSYAAQKPVFGWGPDSLGPLYKGDGFSNTAAHNEYLQLAAELGFPALFLYLAGLSAFFLRIAVKLRKAVSPSENGLSPTSITAAGAALSYLISAFFGVSLFYSAQYFFILLALSSPD
jgi:O-antigen ligase